MALLPCMRGVCVWVIERVSERERLGEGSAVRPRIRALPHAGRQCAAGRLAG